MVLIERWSTYTFGQHPPRHSSHTAGNHSNRAHEGFLLHSQAEVRVSGKYLQASHRQRPVSSKTASDNRQHSRGHFQHSLQHSHEGRQSSKPDSSWCVFARLTVYMQSKTNQFKLRREKEVIKSYKEKSNPMKVATMELYGLVQEKSGRCYMSND